MNRRPHAGDSRTEIEKSQLRKFEKGVRKQYPRIRRRVTRRNLVYDLSVDLPGYDDRCITVKFDKSGNTMPCVTADGPTDSPHRYVDGRLCIWYPEDSPERRWSYSHGLLELLILAQIHLFKEAWWRDTGEWLGPEISH